MMAEAAALDRLLDVAPGIDPARLGGLIDRIVATAEAEGTARGDNVVDFAGARRAPASTPRSAPIHRRSNWQAAALLAASLFVGAFVGTSGILGSGVPSLSGEYDVAEADVADFLIGNRGLLEDDTL